MCEYQGKLKTPAPYPMTDKEILEAKVEVFSELECLEKLQEELAEAQQAAATLHAKILYDRPRGVYVKELMEELADVEIVGHKTLVKLYPMEEDFFEQKLRYGVQVQLRKAIEHIRDKAPCPLPGDACDHDAGCDTCQHRRAEA